VLETDDGIMFRVARTAEAGRAQAVQRSLLRALAPALPVRVPLPEWAVDPGSDGLPFGAIGYRKLPGASLARTPVGDLGLVAAAVGGFLRALHRFPVGEAVRLGAPFAPAMRAKVEALRASVLPALRPRLTGAELRTLERWADDVLADDAMDRFSPAVRHGDLWYEHLLVDGHPPRLVGVLDWEGVGIGDPATDLAVQLYLGEPFLAQALQSYVGSGAEGGAALTRRIRRHWQLREFGGVRWSLEQSDEAELEESLAKLRAGPILGDD
jgi:aminoglycoside phosphotransferase (APT) family kinase protein